jgi:hypothetical protein
MVDGAHVAVPRGAVSFEPTATGRVLRFGGKIVANLSTFDE